MERALPIGKVQSRKRRSPSSGTLWKQPSCWAWLDEINGFEPVPFALAHGNQWLNLRWAKCSSCYHTEAWKIVNKLKSLIDKYGLKNFSFFNVALKVLAQIPAAKCALLQADAVVVPSLPYHAAGTWGTLGTTSPLFLLLPLFLLSQNSYLAVFSTENCHGWWQVILPSL